MVRDQRGRFVPGNGGGPGRPKREREERFLDAMVSKISIQDWREIIDKAVFQAKKGDAVARKFLADYLIGPPVQRQEHTGRDGGPILIVNWEDDTNGNDPD